MSSYFTSTALLVGSADALNKVHALVLAAEAERPSPRFEYLRVALGGIVEGAAYRSGKNRVSPQVGVVLGKEDSAIDALDVCVYLVRGIESDASGLCYLGGKPLHKEGATLDQAWKAFARHCNSIGVSASDLAKAH